MGSISGRTFSGVILAGGKATRLGGRNKGLITVDGVPLIKKNVELLKRFFSEVIVVTNNSEEYTNIIEDIVYVSDIYPEIGPMGGLYTALCSSKNSSVFCIGCDMPFLSVDFISNLLVTSYVSSSQAVVPRINNYIEPLHAVFTSDIIPVMKRRILNNKYSLHGLFESIDVEYMDIPDTYDNRKQFTNINTHKELESLTLQESRVFDIFKADNVKKTGDKYLNVI